MNRISSDGVAAAAAASCNDVVGGGEGPEKVRSLPSVPPKHDPTPKSTDVMLAKYMNSLSMNQRDKVLEIYMV